MAVDGRGADMFGVVRAYADLGDHRTGSQVDHRTARWMAGLLTDRGFAVEHIELPFDRWVSTSSVTIGDSEVEHLALAYEWTGHVDTTDVAVVPFEPRLGGFPAAVDEPIRQAQADGAAAAVLVTEHPHGSLVAVNRVMNAPTSNLPVVLAAGRDLDHLLNNEVRVTMSARIERGLTSNLVARNGAAADEERLLLTTPLNGWFRCAGERGTGIAVLLDLLDRLGDRPLAVAATGGHELGCFGAHRIVDADELRPGAVFHVGASVAVENRTGQLVGTRLALSNLDAERAGPVAEALSAVGLDLTPEAEHWVGEGEAWRRLGCPLVSTIGAGSDFHTPHDVPHRVTSPATLVRVADAYAEAALRLFDLMETS
jgi:hypothetical protein